MYSYRGREYADVTSYSSLHLGTRKLSFGTGKKEKGSEGKKSKTIYIYIDTYISKQPQEIGMDEKAKARE